MNINKYNIKLLIIYYKNIMYKLFCVNNKKILMLFCIFTESKIPESECNNANNRYLCKNKRCISLHLVCNDVNDCGDVSDEGLKCEYNIIIRYNIIRYYISIYFNSYILLILTLFLILFYFLFL